MSNPLRISVRQISERHNPNDSYQDIYVDDLYDNESIYCEDVPNAAKELFLYVKEYGSDKTQDIINFMLINDKEIVIEGEWFEEWLDEYLNQI